MLHEVRHRNVSFSRMSQICKKYVSKVKKKLFSNNRDWHIEENVCSKPTGVPVRYGICPSNVILSNNLDGQVPPVRCRSFL